MNPSDALISLSRPVEYPSHPYGPERHLELTKTHRPTSSIDSDTRFVWSTAGSDSSEIEDRPLSIDPKVFQPRAQDVTTARSKVPKSDRKKVSHARKVSTAKCTLTPARPRTHPPATKRFHSLSQACSRFETDSSHRRDETPKCLGNCRQDVVRGEPFQGGS